MYTETRPWLKNYPSGVPANIDPEQYENLNQFFEECFKKYKNNIAFECMGQTMTYGELDKKSLAFGAYLRSRGLQPGDKVALMMPNLLQYPIAVVGTLRAGLIVVNTNPLYTPREMLHQFEDSDAKAILILENFAANLETILQNTSIKTIITTSIGEMLSPVKGFIVNAVVRHVKKMVPKYKLPNVVSFSTALSEGKKFTITPFPNKLDDVIMLQYTGGTTGVSKGAMLTNRNLVANMLQVKSIMDTRLKEGNEIALSPLPMYHIFAFTVNVLAMTALGAKTVLVTNARDIGSVIKEFKNHKITLMTGLNTLFNALLNNPEFSNIDFSSLKATVSGGMALQRPVAERWEALTGCRISEGYGMTESSPVVSVDSIDGTAILGTIGLPVPSTDIRIVKDDGTIAEVNEVGELQVRGPQVMKGYYQKPEETAKTIVDGWLCTGDMATIDENAYLRIVDRKKDMIIVSGFNVYPNEIEDLVVSHDKVLEAAAVGIPDPKSTEAVKLFVVKKDESLTKEEIMAFCKQNLTGYKMPKEVEFRDSLPKTNVGKILRRELKNS